jgi:hypothetical protein
MRRLLTLAAVSKEPYVAFRGGVKSRCPVSTATRRTPRAGGPRRLTGRGARDRNQGMAGSKSPRTYAAAAWWRARSARRSFRSSRPRSAVMCPRRSGATVERILLVAPPIRHDATKPTTIANVSASPSEEWPGRFLVIATLPRTPARMSRARRPDRGAEGRNPRAPRRAGLRSGPCRRSNVRNAPRAGRGRDKPRRTGRIARRSTRKASVGARWGTRVDRARPVRDSPRLGCAYRAARVVTAMLLAGPRSPGRGLADRHGAQPSPGSWAGHPGFVHRDTGRDEILPAEEVLVREPPEQISAARINHDISLCDGIVEDLSFRQADRPPNQIDLW